MLIITADRRELASAIGRAAAGLPSRPAQPALAGMLLQAHAVDGEGIYLTASDGSMTFTAECKAKIHSGGSALLPGRMLTEVSKYFTGDQVTIDYQGEATAEIIFGRSRVTLSASDGRDYPGWSAPPPPCMKLEAGEFSAAVRQVIPAASGKVNPVLESALLTPRKELVLVATDSYQMAVMTLPFMRIHDSHPGHILIPAAAIDRFSRIVTEGEMWLGWNDRLVMMQAPGVQVTSRQIAGKYLDWEKVLNALPPASGVTLDVPELSAAVKMALLSSGEDGAVKLSLTSEGAVVAAAGQEGRSTGYVALSGFEGEEITFILGGRALLAGLYGSVADIAYTAPLKPLVLRSEGLTWMLQPRRTLTEG